jgi:hypothetical protein
MRRAFFTAFVAILITMFLGFITLAGSINPSNFAKEERGWSYFSPKQFVSSYGDEFKADVENGIGYLVNFESRRFTVFPILSGQRRHLCYIGRCYYGATPEQQWVVKEMNIQYDRITFSESGKFLRLYSDGEIRTSYGIHGHAYFESMIQQDSKFQSMGCILVSDEILEIIEESFYKNGNTLNVLTFS